MFRYEIVEERAAVDERQVEGLLLLCKQMAFASKEDKMLLSCLPLDPLVVAEAKRRLLRK